MRLKGYNFSNKGIYFVTDVVMDRLCLFGRVEDEKIILNDAGKMIEKWILKLEDKFPGIKCHEYVIMPNHFHGIVRILPDSQSYGNGKSSLDPQSNVRATLESPLDLRAGQVPPVHLYQNHQKRLDLSHIIGAFKTTSSKLIHQTGYKNYKWKRSFHDRIIRDDELEIKRNYIRKNPENWEK